MKMTPGRRALDKIFRRRDRYEIPDWQRTKVWDLRKKQGLIDSVLRGWKLPKFYFVKLGEDEYEVVDGQQRLTAIFDFFSNDLPLAPDTIKEFGGPLYSDLKPKISDTFDDFEIEFDEIEGAEDQELKAFFQRLQQGLPLTSSERLNAVHSKMRDFCRRTAVHPFVKDRISVPDTRYAHFDIVAKAAAIEVEGLDAGLRFDDLKDVFESQKNFSSTSAVAKRLQAALDFLGRSFPQKADFLKSRTIVQSLITLTCRLVESKNTTGRELELRGFFERFAAGLASQVELGHGATDDDSLTFQHSVNANVKGGVRSRHEVLIRKLFLLAPKLAEVFDSSVVGQAGLKARVQLSGDSVVTMVTTMNSVHASKHGEDLFKTTNKTAQALARLGRPITTLDEYKRFIDDLYFLFWEGTGSRLQNKPASFSDVNDLRTYLRHDVAHGKAGRVRAKNKKLGAAFAKYAGSGTPETFAPEKFVAVQAALLGAIEQDLRTLVSGTQPNKSVQLTGGAAARG
jgi:Protein of unknown function DUF262